MKPTRTPRRSRPAARCIRPGVEPCERRAMMAAGDLDRAFGDGGTVAVRTLYVGDYATDMAIVGDRILVAGGDKTSTSSSTWIREFSATGAMTRSVALGFGTESLSFPSNEEGEHEAVMAIQPDGKIVAAGSYLLNNRIFRQATTGVVRLNGDLSWDTSFGKVGEPRAIDISDGWDDQVGPTEYATDLAVQPDGKILIVGYSHTSFSKDKLVSHVTRLNPDASYDGTFGIRSDDGSFFGGGGTARVFLPGGRVTRIDAMALQPDGKIVVTGLVSGRTDGTEDVFLARLTTTGLFDTTFGAAGFVIADLGGMQDEATALAIRPGDGKILVGGRSGDDLALALFNADGSPDAGFGVGRRQITDLGGVDRAADLALQVDGKILSAGTTRQNNQSRSALVRFLASGVPDDDFGDHGKVLAPASRFGSSGDARADALAIGPDGKIVIAGIAGIGGSGRETDLVLARYQADASPDIPIEPPITIDPPITEPTDTPITDPVMPIPEPTDTPITDPTNPVPPLIPQPPVVVGTPPAILSIRKARGPRLRAGILVAFSEPMDPALASASSAFRLTSAGRDRRFGTRDDRALRLRSTTYDPATRTLRLVPAGKFWPRRPLRLQIDAASGVADASGTALDGNLDSRPGGSYLGPARWRRPKMSRPGRPRPGAG